MDILSGVDKYSLAHDLIKVALFNVLVHVAVGTRDGAPLFDYKFLYQTFFILLGFAIYHVVLDPRVKAYFASKRK